MPVKFTAVNFMFINFTPVEIIRICQTKLIIIAAAHVVGKFILI